MEDFKKQEKKKEERDTRFTTIITTKVDAYPCNLKSISDSDINTFCGAIRFLHMELAEINSDIAITGGMLSVDRESKDFDLIVSVPDVAREHLKFRAKSLAEYLHDEFPYIHCAKFLDSKVLRGGYPMNEDGSLQNGSFLIKAIAAGLSKTVDIFVTDKTIDEFISTYPCNMQQIAFSPITMRYHMSAGYADNYNTNCFDKKELLFQNDFALADDSSFMRVVNKYSEYYGRTHIKKILPEVNGPAGIPFEVPF